MKQLVALTMIAFLLPATAAIAKGPCKDDKEKFCKDAIAGGGKAGDCLRQHLDELSPACKEKLSKPKEAKADGEKAQDKPAEATNDAPAAGTAPADGSTSKE